MIGVSETATEAIATAQAILDLRERHRELIGQQAGVNGMRLHDLLFDRPLVNVNLVKDKLGVSFATANSLVKGFEDFGLLTEITGGRRGRVFSYDPYLALLRDDMPRRSSEGTSRERSAPAQTA